MFLRKNGCYLVKIVTCDIRYFRRLCWQLAWRFPHRLFFPFSPLIAGRGAIKAFSSYFPILCQVLLTLRGGERKDMRRRENRPFLRTRARVWRIPTRNIGTHDEAAPPPPSHLSLAHRRKRHACKLLPNASQRERERETRDMVEEKIYGLSQIYHVA